MTFGSTGQTSSILGINKTLLVALIMILVVGSVVVVASTLFIVPSLYTTKTKAFTPYSTGVTLRNNISSLRVINVDGDLNITSWSQPNVFINGTVTVRGLNPNPDAITFTESNASGFILFQANFPSSPLLFSPSYVVDINAYVPRNPNLVYVAASTGNGNIRASSLNVGNSGLGFSVNNGKLSASNITASDVDFTVTNGILSALNITASGASSGVGLSVMNGSIDLVCSASCDNVAAITTNGAITAAAGPNIAGGLPNEFRALGGWIIKTVTANIQAADQWLPVR
jgi:hypothetical protein